MKKMMKCLIFTGLFLVLVPNLAQADVDITHLSTNTVISIPVDMIVNANDRSVGFPILDIRPTPFGEQQVVCSALVSSSGMDRTLKGKLIMNVNQVNFVINMFTIDVDSKLDGHTIPLTELICFAGAGDTPNTGISIADFKTYIGKLGGSLSIPAPIPFGR